tara:strand:- start:115 stop:276 length:162 start_codon:yes stop_codon:yes gene_type:complete
MLPHLIVNATLSMQNPLRPPTQMWPVQNVVKKLIGEIGLMGELHGLASLAKKK